MKFPRPITQVHEIELSSRCNLACEYCPNPVLRRPKVDMEWDIYLKALDLVRHYCRAGTQGELALTGVGEALLHPRFAEALLLAREVIGRQRLLTFSTNGILLTDELLHAITPASPVVFISLHRPEVAGLAFERCKKHGVRVATNHAFVDSALDWVGEVQWPVSMPQDRTCEYLRSGWCVVRADGRIGACCWDAETVESLIEDLALHSPASGLVTAPHGACTRCSLHTPMEDEREGIESWT